MVMCRNDTIISTLLIYKWLCFACQAVVESKSVMYILDIEMHEFE